MNSIDLSGWLAACEFQTVQSTGNRADGSVVIIELVFSDSCRPSKMSKDLADDSGSFILQRPWDYC